MNQTRHVAFFLRRAAEADVIVQLLRFPEEEDDDESLFRSELEPHERVLRRGESDWRQFI